jgi:nitrogen fixation/metabolism regulation signal transduction histidine kinase
MTVAEAKQGVALGGLVRMVGHDLRNNLGVMSNSVYYLTMRLGETEPKVTRHLEILARAIALTNRALVDLIDLLEPRVPSPALLDLNALVTSVIERNPPTERSVPVSADLAPGNLWVRGDGEQIARAAENVLLSRYEMLADDASLRISTRAEGGRGLIEFAENGRAYESAEVERWLDVGAVGREPGVHLGLLVAQRLLALNGGELDMAGLAGGGRRCVIALALA